MNSERVKLIAAFAQGASAFDAFLPPAVPEKLLDFRPAEIYDAWTIREHLIHFVEADIHAFTRMRMAVAEPGKRVMVWEELDWHRELRYGRQDLPASVQVMKTLRAVNAKLLGDLDDTRWDKSWIDHPVRGTLTLDALVTTFVEHVDFHLEYIQRNERLWRANSNT